MIDLRDEVAEILTAIAKGDADPRELAARVESHGIGTLDLITMLCNVSAEASKGHRAAQPIDIQAFSRPTPSDVVSRIQHRVPWIPFLLNGTLYDPQDIRRFDGQELHFIARGPDQPMIALDDRSIIATFWQISYISISGLYWSGINSAAGRYQYGGYDFNGTPPRPLPTPPVGWGEKPTPTQIPPGPNPGVLAAFYENDNYEGDTIQINHHNSGFPDLWRKRRGAFGIIGDWDGLISSCAVGVPETLAVLCEETNYMGSTLSFGWWLIPYVPNLNAYGWNDRASSIKVL